MKRAVGYVRVSTDGQFGDDSFGVDNQKAAIEKWAAANDYEICKWYVDVISGTKYSRPQMDVIISGADVTNPPYEAVIAYKNDRIARDTKLYFYYLFKLEMRGVKLICTDEQFGADDPFANIYRSLLQFVAEQERRNISMRTSGGRTVKSSIGGYSGGRSPYGYRIENHSYVIDEEEAEMVRLVFRLLDGGSSLQSVADCINNQGYLTRSGTEFTKSHIRSIRDNRQLYLGYYRYGDMESYVPGQHKPILDK